MLCTFVEQKLKLQVHAPAELWAKICTYVSARKKRAKPNGYLSLELLQIHTASHSVNFAD
jgi:hypothetical protein